MKPDRLLLNRIRTPDGTELTSWFRHDYRTYEDANGHTYMVDGGTDYLRRSLVLAAPFEELSEYYEEENHEHNREYFSWGSYGKDGKGPLRRVLLKDLEDDHIEAILKTQIHISEWLRELFKSEVAYRE